MTTIRLLDLFSGIGGFAKGIEEAGFQIDKHFFSEIDKHAIAVYKHNFPNSIYAGSVTTIQPESIGRIDIIAFGSPCQDFSLAGKRKGLDGERSSLILYAIELIDQLRPSVFIWENVKGAFSSNGGSDFWAIIQEFTNLGNYRLEWQLLNTKWLLPQNRERIYLVGHLANRSKSGVFPITENDFLSQFKNDSAKRWSQAKDIATTLGASGAMRASDTFIEAPKIAGCLTGGGHSGGMHSDMTTIKVQSATLNGYEVAHSGDSLNLSNPNSTTRRGRVGKAVAQTLDTQCNQAVFIGALRGRNIENPSSREKGIPLEQTLEINQEGVSNTLTSVHKDNVVIGTWRTHNDDQGFRKTSDNNCPTIPARAREDGSGQPVVNDGVMIRRLTEIECERLQGFPDDWTKYGNYDGVVKTVPKTQRYKMCGNAVTVKIVKMVAKRVRLVKE